MFEIVSLEQKGLTPQAHIATGQLCDLWEPEFPCLQKEIDPSQGPSENSRGTGAAQRCSGVQ